MSVIGTTWKQIWKNIDTYNGDITELLVNKDGNSQKFCFKIFYFACNEEPSIYYVDHLIDLFTIDSYVKINFLVGVCNNSEAPMNLYIPDELYLKYYTENELKQAIINYETNGFS